MQHLSKANRGMPTMVKRKTRHGVVDVAVMGERDEVLVPLIGVWSLQADKLAREAAGRGADPV